jgi:hypothetical protein
MKPTEFFYANAGYSYDPAHETPEEGRTRCSIFLAFAEKEGRDRGFSFEWSVDDVDSSEWNDEDEPYAQWLCVARDEVGEVIASLSGVDFGPGGEPWGNDYRRVVEAELAQEALSNLIEP